MSFEKFTSWLTAWNDRSEEKICRDGLQWWHKNLITWQEILSACQASVTVVKDSIIPLWLRLTTWKCDDFCYLLDFTNFTHGWQFFLIKVLLMLRKLNFVSRVKRKFLLSSCLYSFSKPLITLKTFNHFLILYMGPNISFLSTNTTTWIEIICRSVLSFFSQITSKLLKNLYDFTFRN